MCRYNCTRGLVWSCCTFMNEAFWHESHREKMSDSFCFGWRLHQAYVKPATHPWFCGERALVKQRVWCPLLAAGLQWPRAGQLNPRSPLSHALFFFLTDLCGVLCVCEERCSSGHFKHKLTHTHTHVLKCIFKELIYAVYMHSRKESCSGSIIFHFLPWLRGQQRCFWHAGPLFLTWHSFTLIFW